jgi:AAA+ ATPase superfamily predicted ATPase
MYCGRKLEELVIRYIIEKNPLNLEFTKIGGYWDRKGEVEIDVVILNEISREAYFLEVKRDAKKLNNSVLENLKAQVNKIGELNGYKKRYGFAYPSNGNLIISLQGETE